MMSNHKLTRSAADMSFFEFRRQLEYKAKAKGVSIVVADMWFPSSKLYNLCGTRADEMTLDVRAQVCVNCNFQHDRDVNAAINLRSYALADVQ